MWFLLSVAVFAADAGEYAPCRPETLPTMEKAALALEKEVVYARHKDLSTRDRECIGLIQAWEESKGVLWSQQEDLDGDGAAESIYVIAHDARLMAPGLGSGGDLKATLAIGTKTVPLTFNWFEGVEGVKEFRTIAIDPTSKKKQVLIRQKAAQGEDPSDENLLAFYSPEKLSVKILSAQGYSRGKLEVPGDGRVGVEDGDCAWSTTTWYRLTDRGLEEAGATRVQMPNAALYFDAASGQYLCPG